MRTTMILIAIISLNINLIKAPLTFEDMSLEDRAAACEMAVEEFAFISSVVEAESDRSESLDGRILIAETILNRVRDNRFPDTITGVLTQRGQFSTVRNGHSIINRTEYSDEAVLIAYENIQDDTASEVLFFNCVGYNIGQAYGYVDGNYFMTLGGIQYDE